jgi:hypothetical protein
MLFDELERNESLIELMTLAEEGSGVRIFIGSENKLFSLSGSSVIVAPWRDSEDRVVGAVGIIGPTRLNYARIVPMVDYTAQLVSQTGAQIALRPGRKRSAAGRLCRVPQIAVFTCARGGRKHVAAVQGLDFCGPEPRYAWSYLRVTRTIGDPQTLITTDRTSTP